MIEIPRRLNLALSTRFMGSRVIPGAMMLSQSVISLFKVPYLVKLSSRCMTNFETNARASTQVHFKAACHNFLAHFSFGL